MMAAHTYYLIYWITALLFVFVSRTHAAALNYEYEENMICIPNATFHIDCNRCKCSPSGMSMDCTDWMCATLQIHYDLLMNLTLPCESGEIFLCNDLKCLCMESSGHALCSTARNELAHEMRPANGDVRVISLAHECPAGLVFKSQHGDTCICHESHRPMQPAASCLGVARARTADAQTESPGAAANSSGDEKQKVCVPSSSFSLDCNQCVCSNDGFSFTCDSFPCLGVEMRDDQLLNLTLACTPSSLFLYNRHECLCSANGIYAICSLASSEITRSGVGEVVVTESKLFCTAGAVFKDFCNICICGKDGKAACTKMDCGIGWDRKRDDEGKIVRKEDLWVQRMRNKRFCRKNDGSMYCRYLRNY